MTLAGLTRRGRSSGSLRALEEHRWKSAFNRGPNAAKTCVKEGCGRIAWRQNKKGHCWHHSGRMLAKENRKSEHAWHNRGIRAARYLAQRSLSEDPPSRDAVNTYNSLKDQLISNRDQDRLLMLCREFVDKGAGHNYWREGRRILLKQPASRS